VVGLAADRDRVADHLGDRAEVHNNIGRHHRGAAGVAFLAAMANEFFIASVRLGWRWAQVLMGIIFLAVACGQSCDGRLPSPLALPGGRCEGGGGRAHAATRGRGRVSLVLER
jgi:hypothetical protein